MSDRRVVHGGGIVIGSILSLSMWALLALALLTAGCATALTNEGCTTDDECENGARVVCVDYWDADKGLIPGECS
jgi:hypothetical protein